MYVCAVGSTRLSISPGDRGVLTSHEARGEKGSWEAGRDSRRVAKDKSVRKTNGSPESKGMAASALKVVIRKHFGVHVFNSQTG